MDEYNLIHLASDVLARHKADDPLYLPMLERVRRMVSKSGLLYAGDSKEILNESPTKKTHTR